MQAPKGQPSTATAESTPKPDNGHGDPAGLMPLDEFLGEAAKLDAEEATQPTYGTCRKHGLPAPVDKPCLDAEEGDDDPTICTKECADWMAPDVEAEPDSQPKLETDYRVVDASGNPVQLSLLGAEYERQGVREHHIALSGSEDFLSVSLQNILEGELCPGAIVEVFARGVVRKHAPVYAKGFKGDTVIKLESLKRITVTGQVGGKIEAARNVDEEIKDPEPAAADEAEEPEAEPEATEPRDETPSDDRPACYGALEDDIPPDALCNQEGQTCPWENDCIAESLLRAAEAKDG